MHSPYNAPFFAGSRSDAKLHTPENVGPGVGRRAARLGPGPPISTCPRESGTPPNEGYRGSGGRGTEGSPFQPSTSGQGQALQPGLVAVEVQFAGIPSLPWRSAAGSSGPARPRAPRARGRGRRRSGAEHRGPPSGRPPSRPGSTPPTLTAARVRRAGHSGSRGLRACRTPRVSRGSVATTGAVRSTEGVEPQDLRGESHGSTDGFHVPAGQDARLAATQRRVHTSRRARHQPKFPVYGQHSTARTVSRPNDQGRGRAPASTTLEEPLEGKNLMLVQGRSGEPGGYPGPGDQEAGMDAVASSNGSAIAGDRSGKGPLVIVVGGALQRRAAGAATAQLAGPVLVVVLGGGRSGSCQQAARCPPGSWTSPGWPWTTAARPCLRGTWRGVPAGVGRSPRRGRGSRTLGGGGSRRGWRAYGLPEPVPAGRGVLDGRL